VKRLFAGSVFLTIVLILLNSIVFGQQSSCKDCHERVFQIFQSRSFIHPVVKDCRICHIKKNRSSARTDSVEYLTSTYADEFIVHIPDIKNQDCNISVELYDINERRSGKKEVPLACNSVSVRDGLFTKINKIYNFRVENIRFGPLVSVVFSWETDAYSTTEISYITKNSGVLPTHLGDDNVYTKKHRILITGLGHKKTYQFKGISRDIYGNKIETEEVMISTNKRERVYKSSGLYGMREPIQYTVESFRVSFREGIFVSIKTNIPSRCRLVITSKESIPVVTGKHEAGLTSPRFASIVVCKRCHPQHTSHPVGIRSEGAHVRMPVDLPTIEDGVISCTTCHYPHGGDREFFARSPFDATLCLKCHDESLY